MLNCKDHSAGARRVRWHSLQSDRPSSVGELAYIGGGLSCTLHRVLYDGHHMPRTAPGAQEITHERIVQAPPRALPPSGYGGTHAAAITMVGALLLARAVDDPRLSDALLKAALKHLAPAGT